MLQNTKIKAIHHHIIINHIEGHDVSKVVRTLWKFGRPGFKYLDGSGQYKDLASYLIKETSKTFKEMMEGTGRGTAAATTWSCQNQRKKLLWQQDGWKTQDL